MDEFVKFGTIVTIRGRRWAVLDVTPSRRQTFMKAASPIDGGLTDLIQIQKFTAPGWCLTVGAHTWKQVPGGRMYLKRGAIKLLALL